METLTYSQIKYRSLTDDQKAQAASRAKRWKADNPVARKRSGRRAHLKRRYGITLELYESMYESQSGACAVCSSVCDTLDVDHNHDSGEILGLLCHRCNWALGILGDNPELLRNAAAYFDKYRSGDS